MKKLFSLLVALALVLTLAACDVDSEIIYETIIEYVDVPGDTEYVEVPGADVDDICRRSWRNYYCRGYC